MLWQFREFWKSYKGDYVRWMFAAGYRYQIIEWLQSRREDYLLITPSPWITFEARRFLKGIMSNGLRVFEYGSRGSTLFWLKHKADCVSVEHDSTWAAILQQYLASYPPDKLLQYHHIPPQPSDLPIGSLDPSDPQHYASADAQFRDMQFRSYAMFIDQFADQSFDIVFVDGRARPACIMHAVSKIRRGGWLIVDNADRDYYYEQTYPFLAGFEKTSFFGPGPIGPTPWQTDFFQR